MHSGKLSLVYHDRPISSIPLLRCRIIVTRHVADGSVTTRKLKPTYYYVSGTTGTASRQTLSGTTWTPISGAIQSYTSGATAELLWIQGTALVQATASGSQCGILVNGTLVGKTDYADTPMNSTYFGRNAYALYEISANTTVTISLGARLGSGTGNIANSTADPANGYAPTLAIIAFGR